MDRYITTCGGGEEELAANLQVLVSNTILRETIQVARREEGGIGKGEDMERSR